MLFIRPQGGKEASMSRESFLYRRVAGNPIEPLLIRFVDLLIEKRYSASACISLVGAAGHFGRWLGRRPLNERIGQAYLTEHLVNCRCEGSAPCNRHWNGIAVRQLLTLEGITRPLMVGFGGEVLRRYREYLSQERGLKANSIRYSLRQAKRTLSNLKVRTRQDLSRWTVQGVRSHLVLEVEGFAGSTAQVTVARMRVFLRFLHRERLIANDLASAVPTVPFWRRKSLPSTIDPQTLDQLVMAAASDRSSTGLRNYAIVLSLRELGLRASDLMSLELDHVDCPTRILRLRQAKGRQELVLPISRKLANAIESYLKRGRPACTTAWVFVRHRAPIGRQFTSAGVRNVLVALSMVAGLPTPIQSTHAFRRALATKMLQSGANLKQIADVLGHRSVNTTARYTHIDMASLSQVALPWPIAGEVQP
jgi:site-specific recombinase XerD